MNLPRPVFKYVEYELYNYDSHRKVIEEAREDIIYFTPHLEIAVSGGKASDPTARKGTELATNRAIIRMCRTIDAIDRALAKLNDDHRQLFELKYRKHLPWQRICMKMNVSETTYKRYRRRVVEMVAAEMGLGG